MLRRGLRRATTTSRVDGFTGLLTTFCAERGIHAIVKGLRAVSDFDYELQMAQMNSSLTDVETVFVPTSPEYSFLASSLVKEVATFGGDVSGLLPDFVHERARPRASPSEPPAPRAATRRGAGVGGFADLRPRPVTIPNDLSCPATGSESPEQTGPESAARARHTRARPPPGVPARGDTYGAGTGRSGHRSSPCPRRLAGRTRPAARGGHGGGAGHAVRPRPSWSASACGAWSRSRTRCPRRVPGAVRVRRPRPRPRRGRRDQPARGRPARPRATAAGRGGARTAVPAAVQGGLSRDCAPSVAPDWPTIPTTRTRQPIDPRWAGLAAPQDRD